MDFRKLNLERLNQLEKNVPTEMKEMNNWCAFKTYFDKQKNKKKKFIIDSKTGKWASSIDSTTWTSFAEALDFAKRNNFEGLSFALNSNITCIDLDKCVDGKKINNNLARHIYNNFKEITYIEKSVSGSGLHIFLKDKILSENYKNRVIADGQEIEVYDANRFISMTGNLVSSCDNRLNSCPSEMKNFLQRRLKKPVMVQGPFRTNFSNSDSDVLERIRKSKKGDEFEALWQGNSLTGDRSRDDFKLLNILAFFTNQNADQMERLFKQSGLYRPEKKDNYVKLSVENAIKTLIFKPNNLQNPKSRNQQK